MPALDREGYFRVTPLEVVVRDQSKAVQTVMIGVRFRINEAQIDKEWQNWSEYEYEVYGNYCIIKKNGALNETTAEQFRDVLGWDGNFDLDDWVPEPCQVKVKQHEYEGRISYRAAWLYPYDHEGGMRACDPSIITAMNTTHGSMMRAFFGERAILPPKPVGRPTPPQPQATKPTSSLAPQSNRAPALPDSTAEQAWKAWHVYRDTNVPGMADDDLTGLWKDILSEKFHNKPFDSYTAKDWGWIETVGVKSILPF